MELAARARCRLRGVADALRAHVRAAGRGRRASPSRSTVDPDCAGGVRADAQRLRADPEEPAVQRDQVHRARARWRCACSAPRRPAGRLRGARHRHRHRAGPAGAHLRGLPPGRRQHQPALRRHRAGPVDLARPGAPAGRRHSACDSAPGEGSTLHAGQLPADMRAGRARRRRPADAAPVPRVAAPGVRRRSAAAQRAAPDQPRAARDAGLVAGRPRQRRATGPRWCWWSRTTRTSPRILCDLAHELGFHCVVAHQRRRGAARWPRELAPERRPARHRPARPLRPGACSSGSSATPRTRHIPVHVVSAQDRAQTALRAGRDRLRCSSRSRARSCVEALARAGGAQLSAKVSAGCWSSRTMPRRARASAQLLRRRRTWRSSAVGTVAEALAAAGRRAPSTAWCIDLTLPDMQRATSCSSSMAARRAPRPFPPVIVYTGRALSARRGAAAAPLLAARSSSRARARPSGCSTRSRCSCTRSRRSCRPSSSACCAGARSRDSALDGRRILVVEDDVRNIFALTSVLEPQGADAGDRAQRPRGARARWTQPEASTWC